MDVKLDKGNSELRPSASMDQLPRGAVDEIRRLVRDLVDRSYELIALDGRAGRLSARELEAATPHHRTVIAPPVHAFDSLDCCRVDNQRVPTCSVEMPVWTKEDGASDWTLSLTITEKKPGTFDVEIDDLHVL
jgi:hypothetical protein